MIWYFFKNTITNKCTLFFWGRKGVRINQRSLDWCTISITGEFVKHANYHPNPWPSTSETPNMGFMYLQALQVILIHAQVCEPLQWSNSASLMPPSCLFLVTGRKAGENFQINIFERRKWACETLLALLSLVPFSFSFFGNCMPMENRLFWGSTVWQAWRADAAPWSERLETWHV